MRTNDIKAGERGCKPHSVPDAIAPLRSRTAEPDRRIELVAVARLIASKTNVRTHSSKQVCQLAAGIKNFGSANS